MTHQQKRYLKFVAYKNLGFVFGTVGPVLMFVFGLSLDGIISGILVLISFVIMLIGLIFIILLSFLDDRFRLKPVVYTNVMKYGYKGVPNNSFREFDFPISSDICLIEMVEQSKNIYKTTIQSKDYLFDMRGWNKPEKYIYQIILCKLQIKYANSSKNIPKSIKVPIDNLKIIFHKTTKKNTEFVIVRDNLTQISVLFSLDLRSKLQLLCYSKVKITDLYDFN